MPALAKLCQQHKVLAAPRHETTVLRLGAAFTAAAAPFGESGILPAGLIDALGRDLLYVLIRHVHWTAAPLYADVVIDSLATEYGLERAVASAITHALLPLARRLAPPSHLEATDAEFLRYLCVTSATAENESELIVDLGLGTNLLTRIKSAVRLLVASDAEPGAGRFLPELDAKIVEILLGFAQEQQTVPWALQVHKLRFLLAGIAEPWRGLLAVHGARWAHELLLALATRGTASARQLAAKLAKLLPAVAGAGDEAFVTELLTAFAGFGLCYGERDRWHALPLAQELTADAYARNRLNTPESPWKDLESLAAPFQAALVRSAPDCSEARLVKLLLGARPFAAPVLAAALGRLSEIAGTACAAATVAKMLQGESSPWLRQATCDALGSLTTPLPVGQTLSEVAKSDPSLAVQSAALRAALKHGAPAFRTDDADGGASARRAEAPARSVPSEPGC